MNIQQLLSELEQKQHIESGQKQLLSQYEQQKPVSLFGFLRMLLYVSLSAFVTGAGVLIYQNIDTLGHTVLMALLAMLTAACFVYVFKKGESFSFGKVVHSSSFVEVVLLLGCLLFLALEGYAQYQYGLFGTRYGLAVFLPALFFLFLAYRFDHQGVLSLGLTALASWVGLTATPDQVLVKNDFSDPAVIQTALAFGLLVVALSWLLEKRGIKRHFSYTYLLVAGTLYLVACLGGMFTMDAWQAVFALLLGIGCWYFFQNAREESSLLFLLISVLFGYIGFTYLLFTNLPAEIGVFLGSLYFMLSAGGVIWFFLNFKKLLRKPSPQSHESLQ
ncbi:DUF2157 domain-containing protein [Telluribacter humicola]|uniref:DUF2157 domain-containing protein n=1 Tax=Telluribacter humicola TaxID=1720261 RepID=UPI001A968695|nr:DUF2157 domain-containing protein [Telluribacter humicola]